MVNNKSSRPQKHRAILRFTFFVAALLLLNYVAHFILFRIDLTNDKRYTLADVSKRTMQQLDNNVYVSVYLDGAMPIEMKKLRTTIKETLDELKVYSHSHLYYEFVNISEEVDPKELPMAYASLREQGLSPIVVEENKADGSRSEQVLFPGAIIRYIKSDSTGTVARETAVNFLENNSEINSDEELLTAQQNVETSFISAISRVTRKQVPQIAFIEGHGELDEYEVGDIYNELSNFATIDHVLIDGNMDALDEYDIVIIAKPKQAWADEDKIVLDQYIMHGGRVAWFIDAVDVHHDSLSNGYNTFALYCNHGLDELLFKYGVRINPNVISDLQCAYLPINIAPAGQTADFKLAPWTYYPLLIPPPQHVITQGLNLIEAKYPSTIDTVGKKSAVAKQILLHTSEHSRTQTIPALISLSETRLAPDPAAYQQRFLPVAVLLEGNFSSAFAHRPLEKYNHQKPFAFKSESEPTKMIVVADGDIIRNDIVRLADGTRIFPLGFDRYMNIQFGNRGFVKNCIYYLLDDDNTMQIRRREWQLRLLDKTKIYSERKFWIAVNSAAPVLLTLIAYVLFAWLRKRKYATTRTR